MTGMIRTVVVVLDREYREDDAEPIIAAIQQIRGVAKASGEVADMGYYTAKMAALTDLRSKMSDFVTALWKDDSK